VENISPVFVEILRVLVTFLIAVITVIPGIRALSIQRERDRQLKDKEDADKKEREDALKSDVDIKISEISLKWASEFKEEVSRINAELERSREESRTFKEESKSLRQELNMLKEVVRTLETEKKELSVKVDLLTKENTHLKVVILSQQEQITELQKQGDGKNG
jgi:hypothetical protein